MLFRSSLFLALSLLFAPAAEAGEWSVDFSNRRVSVQASSRGHRVTQRRFAPRKVWVPGCYEMQTRRVWVEGCKRKVYVEPLYETRFDACGRAYQVLLREGHYRIIRDPGTYENRRVRVWRPGFWRVTRSHRY